MMMMMMVIAFIILVSFDFVFWGGGYRFMGRGRLDWDHRIGSTDRDRDSLLTTYLV